MDVYFDQAIDASTLTASDVAITNARGENIALDEPQSLNAYNNAFRFFFTDGNRENGVYSITVGPDVRNTNGVEMNQDGSPPNGGEEDAYSGEFTLATPDLQIAVDNDLLPDEALLGTWLNVPIAVSNVGAADALGNWQEKVWLSKDQTLSGDDYLLTTVTHGASGRFSLGLSADSSLESSVRVQIPLDNRTWNEGDYYLIVAADVGNSVFETFEDNNVFVSKKVAFSFPELADLTVTSVIAPASAVSGQPFELVWTTANSGARNSTEKYRDSIYITRDGTLENALLLKTVNFEGGIEAGGSVQRRATVSVPSTGYVGSASFIVVCDVENSVPEEDDGNNSLVSSPATILNQTLNLSLSANRITEGTSGVRGVVSRTGDVSQPLTVFLYSSDDTELLVPESVTIQAGQASASFGYSAVSDGDFDEDEYVDLRIAADGFDDRSVTVCVANTDRPELTMSFDKRYVEEGESFEVTVTRNYVTDKPITVRLTPSSSSQVTVPSSVTILANEASTTFNVIATDDDRPESDADVTIVALSPNFVSASKSISIGDDDEPTIAVTLSVSSVVEGAGGNAFSGTVTRTQPASSPLRVRLTSSNPGKIGVPSEVTIPSGKTSVVFYGASYDNGAVEGESTVTITATGVLENCNCSMSSTSTGVASTTISVLDDDGPKLTLSLDKVILAESTVEATTLTIKRNTPSDEPITVFLTATEPLLLVSNEVVIPAGSSSVSISVGTAELDEGSDDVWATVEGSCDGFVRGAARALVTTTPLPDFVVSNVDAVQKESDLNTFIVSYDVLNLGGRDVEGSWVEKVWVSSSPTLGDDAVLIATFPSSGTLSSLDGANRLTRSFEYTPINFIEKAYWHATVDVDDAVRESIETNNTFVSEERTYTPPYAAVVQTDVEKADPLTSIPLYGYAYNVNTGARMPNVGVDVYISAGSGASRKIAVTTDETGAFSTVWEPLSSEIGSYTVGAIRSGGDASYVPRQDSFNLMKMTLSVTRGTFEISEGETVSGSFKIYNNSSVPVTGLGYAVEGLAENLKLDVKLSSTVIPAGNYVTVTLSATALDALTPASQATLRFTSAETPDVSSTLCFNVYPGYALLTADTSNLSHVMTVGEQKIVEFEICNESGVASGPISVVLPQLDWLSCIDGNTLDSLAPGEARSVRLLLSPAADLPQRAYQGSFALNYKNSGLTVNFNFRARSDNYSDLTVKAVDENYYYTDDKPTIKGASVKVFDSVTKTLVSHGVTDEDGNWIIRQLPEGYYDVYVSAENHNTYNATVYVEDDTTLDALLPMQTVRYEWSVTPTTIEDEYDVTLNVTYEVNVPAPVLTISPSVIDLTSLTRAGQRLQVDITVENHGLIALYDVAPFFAETPNFQITPLVESLEELPAKSKYVIPIIFERITDFGSETSDENALNTSSNDIFLTSDEDEYNIGFPKTTRGVNMNSVVFDNQKDLSKHREAIKQLAAYNDQLTDKLATSGLVDVCAFGMGLLGTFLCGLDFIDVVTPGILKEACRAKNIDVEAGQYHYDSNPGVTLEEVFVVKNTPVPGGNGSVVSPRVVSSSSSFCKPILDCLPYTSIPGCVDSLLSPSHSKIDAIQGALSCASIVNSWAGYANCLITITRYITKYISNSGGYLSSASEISYEESVDNLLNYYDKYKQQSQWLIEIFGSEDFLNENSIAGLSSFLEKFNNKLNADKLISEQGITELENGVLPEGITKERVRLFSERWNRTVLYFESGIMTVSDVPEGESTDFIDWQKLSAYAQRYEEIEEEARNEGFESLVDALFKSYEDVRASIGESSGVCSKVKLELKQKAVLTRDAFDAQLVLDNMTDSSLQNVYVDIIIYDQWGNDVTDKFGFYAPTTQNFYDADENNLGKLSAHSSGQANWIFVPSTECAQGGAETYSVGGVLHYTEGGRDLSIPMVSASITVYPQPELDLLYFWQRDAVADDPWTDEVEESEPFELAVMVKNNGNGEAKNLRIISAQPEIVENEKGLLIDFKIVGSQLNGKDYAANELTINFGDVAPKGVTIGQWFLETTLQGHFIDYEASFQHVNGFNDLQFSLIKNVEIHELIHSVKDTSEGADDLPDFLVNDVGDMRDIYDLPDTLYLSSGEVESVAVTTDYTLSKTLSGRLLTVDLTVEASEAGWNYIWLQNQDPGGDEYSLYRVVRSDGTELDPANFWQTNRTYIDFELGDDLVKNENSLHLLDYFASTVQSYSYTLYYKISDETGPSIVSLGELPSPYRTTPLESVDVEFSEPIDATTFSRDNISLKRGGSRNLINEFVTVEQISEKTYRISGLSSLTKSDGVYELTVSSEGIADVYGNVAESADLSLNWTNAVDSPMATVVAPPEAHTQTVVDSVAVTFSKPINASTFTLSDLTLTRNDGTNLLSETSNVSIVAQSPTEWTVSGLSALTSEDGAYVLTIKTAGLLSESNKRGVGVETVSWTKDSVGPSTATWAGLNRRGTNYAYDYAYLAFDEEIKFETLDFSDFTLTRNGETVALDSRLVMGVMPESIKTTSAVQEWKLVGLSRFASQDGEYVLTVDLSDVGDLAGNLGTGRFSVTWTVDTQVPELSFGLDTHGAPRGVLATSDEGVGVMRVDSTHISLSGELSEPNMTVHVYDEVNNEAVFAGTFDTTVFNLEFELPQEGYHKLRIRAVDFAGNAVEYRKDVFVDLTSPFVSDMGIESTLLGDAADRVVLSFTEGTNLQDLIDDGSIVDVVTLTNALNGTTLSLRPSDYTYNPTARTLEISLASVDAEDLGLFDVPEDAGSVTAPLNVSIDSSRIVDLVGRTMRGSDADALNAIPLRFAASRTLASVDSYSVPSLVDWNGDGRLDLMVGEKSADGFGRVKLFLNEGTNAAPSYADGFYARYWNSETETSEVIAVEATGCQGAAPRAVDVNGDGALDLFVGRSDGTILFYQGEGTADSWRLTAPISVQYGADGAKTTFDSGDRAVFDVCDWNGDGRYDLLVGSVEGKLYLLIDSAVSGDYDFQNAVTLTNVDGSGELVLANGRTAPALADVNGDGLLDLVSGDTLGELHVSLNVGTDANPQYGDFVPLNDLFGAIKFDGARRTRPFAYDYDGDGVVDLLVGSSTGETTVYRGVRAVGFNSDGALGAPFAGYCDWTLGVTAKLASPNVVVTVTGSAVVLNIKSVDNAARYVVKYGVDPEFETCQTKSWTTSGSKTLSGLAAGSIYYFRAYAVSADGLESEPTCFTVATPLAAPTLTLVSRDYTSISVEVGESTNATAYTLAYSTNSDFSNATTMSVASGAVTIEGLEEGTLYYFRVRAADSGSVYPTSAWTKLSAKTDDHNPKISFSSNKPSYNKLLKATLKPTATVSYQWYRVSKSGVETAISGATKANYLPAAADVGQYLKLVATGANFVSEATTESVVTRALVSVTLPTTTKYNMKVKAAVSPSSATVSYQWYRGSSEDGWTAIAGATKDYYIPGAADVGLHLKVEATGTGVYTGTVSKTSVNPVTRPLVSITVTSTVKVGTKITSYLSPSSGTVTYQWYRGSSKTSVTEAIPGATDKTYTPTVEDGGYYLKVVAKGYGSSVGTVSRTTAKAVPVVTAQLASPNVSASPTAVSVSLSWRAVSKATEYQIEYKEAGSETYLVAGASSKTSFVVSDLLPLTAYDVRVRAVSPYVISSEWTEISVTTRNAQLDSPDVTLGVITESAIELVIASVDGATSYQVQYSASETFASVTTLTYPDAGSKTVSGLAEGQTYYIRVKAKSSVYEASEWTVVSATTDATVSTGTDDASNEGPSTVGDFSTNVFYDVEKTSSNNSNMCWAAGAANVLYYTGWAQGETLVDQSSAHETFDTADDVYLYLVENFTNLGSSSAYACEWFLTGEYAADNLTGWSQRRGDGGGFYQTVDFDDVSAFYSYRTNESPDSIFADVAAKLVDGWGVCVSVGYYAGSPGNSPVQAHTVTLWGYGCDLTVAADDPNYFTSVRISDSDDSKYLGRSAPDRLRDVSLAWSDEFQRYELLNFASSGSAWIEELVAIAPVSVMETSFETNSHGDYATALPIAVSGRERRSATDSVFAQIDGWDDAFEDCVETLANEAVSALSELDEDFFLPEE